MNNIVFPEKEIEFFGRITASVSHELNNVLSIINEYSGLLSDLLEVCGKDESVDPDKILSIAKNIADQIKREKEIINLLNRFSHNVDSPFAEFNLNDLISDIVRLTKRFASLKRIELRLSLYPEEIRMTSNPCKIQHAVFLLLSLALESGSSTEYIEIAAAKDAGNAVVQITVPSIPSDSQIEQQILSITDILESIKGRLENTDSNGDKNLFKIILPLSIEEV